MYVAGTSIRPLRSRREAHVRHLGRWSLVVLAAGALALLRELGHEPHLADVDTDDELFRLYDWRVPVVLADGVIVGEGRITKATLKEALKRSRGEP